ncbi:MAG: hypothetical protein OEZ37_08745, partial [Gemmatimonadota bacterium]|nr:hypothetical protein [Gemmatimonadota bacterium]
HDGDVSELSVRVGLNPSDFVTFELSGTRNTGTLPAGEIFQEVLGAQVRVNFSPDLQLAFLGQCQREGRTEDNGECGGNTRLRWTFDPLGDLFVVYNYNTLETLDRGWEMDSSQFLVKIQYALRN